MINLRNQYLEKRIRKSLNVSETYILSEDDLVGVTGIYIDNSDDIDNSAIPVYWDLDFSSAFKMRIPNLLLNYAELILYDEWEDDLRLLSNIRSFYCSQPISHSLLGCYSKLNDLNLSCMEISDWSFLTGMMKLRNIVLYGCGHDGNQALKHLCDLYTAQFSLRKHYGTDRKIDPINQLLENVAIINMGIDDISPLRHVKRLTELNLSRNAIKDISPLSEMHAYCVVLGNNRIENVNNLNIKGISSLQL